MPEAGPRVSTPRRPRLAAALTAGVGLLAIAACGDRAPEPVLFALAEPELFADGGALTDAWADFDLDGYPDRFVGFNGTPSRLYRNGGTDGLVGPWTRDTTEPSDGQPPGGWLFTVRPV